MGESPNIPTVILVHGGFADASFWAPVIKDLQAHNVPVLAPPNPLRGLAHDAEYIASYVNQVDGPVLRGRHQPRAGIIGHAGVRPLFKGDDQRVLREFLGQADVADKPGEPRDQPGRLDPPDRFHRAMGWIGGRHSYRSNHHRQAGGVKSSGPNTFSTSDSPSQPGHMSRCNFMNREVHSTASSFVRTSHSA